MPRSVRIEYHGALYHVMARGNRREVIFLSDSDREMFLHTLEQTCERNGWRVLAWVLMGNHYHLAIHTPEPNLVAGMTWLQTTYTRRFNSRHQQWGRLFGDRYKAIPVEGTDDRRLLANRPADYLTTLIDYIHLNPVRAGLISPSRDESILDFPWSSVARGYGLPPRKRPSWFDAERGLALVGYTDVSRDRRSYVKRLDRRAVAEEAESCGLPESEIEAVSEKRASELSGGLRRGWYWGSDQFRERMIAMAEGSAGTKATFKLTAAGGDHAKLTAERIIAKALEFFDLENEEALKGLTDRGDLRRAAVAWAIWRHTSMPQGWIAERLNLRNAANASQQIRRFQNSATPKPSAPVRKWRKEMSRILT